MAKVKSRFTIPCHWDRTILSQIKKQREKEQDIEIVEVYGAPTIGPILNGRSIKSVKMISREDAVDFRNYAQSLGFSFNYLLNAPFEFKNKDTRKIEEYIEWVVNDFKADSVTISSYELMEFIRQKHPKLKINVSTIAGVQTAEDLEKYVKIKPSKIVLHHDANRNFSELKNILEKAGELETIIELMVTESCLRRCSNRKQHYETLSTGIDDTLFHMGCNTKKVMYPAEILKSNFIRPEDLEIYEQLGVRHFKITGRSKNPKWLPDVTNAYLNRSYDGNLIRLLGIDPKLAAENWIYIDNKSLDGFLKEFPLGESKENVYCNQWSSKLFKENKLKIEGALYEINKEDVLICKKLPVKLSELYGK